MFHLNPGRRRRRTCWATPSLLKVGANRCFCLYLLSSNFQLQLNLLAYRKKDFGHRNMSNFSICYNFRVQLENHLFLLSFVVLFVTCRSLPPFKISHTSFGMMGTFAIQLLRLAIECSS